MMPFGSITTPLPETMRAWPPGRTGPMQRMFTSASSSGPATAPRARVDCAGGGGWTGFLSIGFALLAAVERASVVVAALGVLVAALGATALVVASVLEAVCEKS